MTDSEPFRALFEQIAEGVFIIGSDRHIELVNRAGCILLGMTDAEIIGCDPQIFARDTLNYDIIPYGPQSYVAEHVVIKSDGSLLYLEITSNRMSDGRIISSVHDITQRKAEQAQIAHFASFPSLNPEPIIELDLSGNVLYTNPAVDVLLERVHKPGQIVMFIPRDIDFIIAQVKSSSQTLFTREVRVNGNIFTQSVYYTKELNSLRIYNHDVTELRRTNKLLEESERLWHTLFHCMSEGVALHNVVRNEAGEAVNYVILDVNSSYEHVIGEKRENVAGKLATDVYHTATAPYLAEYVGCAEPGRTTVFETYFAPLDKWFMISVAGIETDKFATIFTDITQHKITETKLQELTNSLEHTVKERTEQLTAANLALEEASKMKDTFLASMSHELRTPLTGILGLTESLDLGIYGDLSAQQRKAVNMVHDSGDHLLSLIADILDLAKIGAGRMDLDYEMVSVVELCRASMSLLAQPAQVKDIRISLSIDPTVTEIAADSRRLKQILVNLLSNAIKFTNEHGAAGIRVSGDADEQIVRFTVWDTGIGIAEDKMDLLFKPFVQIDNRLSRQYNGTGLGLALVSEFTEMHGGRTEVESRLGQGSSFTAVIPWRGKEAVESKNAYRHPEMLRNALIVEDSPLAVSQITRYLHELGVNNIICDVTGSNAVSKAAAMQPDVILLDIMLPSMSGWDILRELKSSPATKDIPVIVVSVLTDYALATSLGASAYVNKPISRSDISIALHKALNVTVPDSAMVIERNEGKIVLIVDDNDTTIMTLGDFLSNKGYKPVIAKNGREGIELAKQQCPSIILMDIQMPVLDGISATKEIRMLDNTDLANVPIIALTALAMPGDRERCLAAGVNEYVAKPIKLPALLNTIKVLLHEDTETSN